jgi:arylsulfatase
MSGTRDVRGGIIRAGRLWRVKFLAGALALAWLGQPAAAADEAPRPNIVLIYCDDLGYGDLGVFGAKGFATPHLDRMAAEGKQLTTWYAQRAVGFIERNKERPFFLYVAHSMPHVPLHVSDKFRGTSSQGLYGDVIQEIDWSVGEILSAIKKNGLDDRTLVIFTSDNGPWLNYGNHAGSAGPLREGKGTSWEGGVREPFVARWPGKIPAGAVCRQPAMTIDMLPTIAGLVGAKLPEHKIDGLDVWPLLSGDPQAKNPHEAYYIYYADNELQAVMSGNMKLYLPHAYRTLSGRSGGRDGRPVNYDQRKVTTPELYDVDADISETKEIAAEHPAVVQRLLALAEQARGDLGDSLTAKTGAGVREPGRLTDE